VAIGAAILAFGALIHETWVRHERERQLTDELDHLTASRDAVLDELDATRAQMKAIHGRLAEQAASADAIGDMQAEVKLLHGLVRQLTGESEPAGEARRRPPPRIIDAGSLGDGEILALVRDAVRHDRVDVLLQPIVSLPQRRPRHFFCTGRLRTEDGGSLMPEQYAALAERAGLITPIENLLLLRSVQLARAAARQRRQVGYFAPLSARSLRDHRFMDQFVEFLADNAPLMPSLVFALPADSLAQDPDVLAQPIARLNRLGARLALTGSHDLGAMDVDALTRLGIRFVGADARTLLMEAAEGVDLRALKSAFDREAVDLIAEGVEAEETLVEILDLPVDFGRGPLFGPPEAA
jgi:cyclic-di-GMP phosphodiesterase TipF (flagellum assembly factor)